MTYKYNDIDQGDALYNAARRYPGGIPALAQRLGWSADTLKKKLSPAVSTHVLSYEEASCVIELLDEVVPDAADLALDAFNWRHERISIKLPEAGDIEADHLLQRIVEIFHEEGELANDINAALKTDRRIDDDELSRIEKHLQQSMEKLVQLREEVRAKHRLDKGGV